jgi:hypothetical protein
MSERRRNEKEDEKHEKEDEKKQEKQMDEKFRRDPVRGITFAVILIWGGIVAWIQVANLVKAEWWQAWAVFFIGTGVILLVKAAFRLRPEHRRSIGGTVIIGLVLIGVGLGDIIGWGYSWPIILIVIGVLILGRVFWRRR